MATQYTDKLKLALPTQGELSGTWGTVVNDNITAMVEEAIAGRSVINTWTANAHTLTTADGTTSESRCAMLEFTDTGTALTGAGQVICPAKSKMYVAKNGAGQTITVKTSSGTGVAVPNGETMWVYCDGTNVEEAVTYINTLGVGTVDIDGGTIDGVSIGNTTAATKAVIDNVTIDGGTVGTTSNSLTLSTTTSGDVTITSADSVDINSGSGTNEDITLDNLSIENNGFTISTATDGDLTIDPSGTTSVVNVSKNLDMPDDKYLRLGNTQNLVLGHANFYQTNVVDSEDNLILFSKSNITLSHGPTSPFSGQEFMIYAVGDGSVSLYYDGTKKFETLNGGAQVTGTLICDDVDINNGVIDLDTTSSGTVINLESTNTDSSASGPDIYLYRNDTLNETYPNTPSAAIKFTSRHEYAGFIHSTIQAYKDSGSVASYAGSIRFFNTDAASTSLVERMRMSKDGIIINENSDAGTDFRVESDSNQHMLFVDSSANAIGINNSSPSSALDVTGDVAVSGSVVSTVAINAQTGTTYTLVLTDQSKLVTLDNSSAITLTVPPNSSVAYPTGSKIDLLAKGAGQVTVAAGTGVTVNSSQTLKLRDQWSAASLIKLATDTWVLVGDLEAS